MFFLKVFWLLILALGCHLDAQPFSIRTRAESAVVYNPDNGAIIFSKDPKKAHYPASIMKIATALFVLEKVGGNIDRMCVASARALERIEAGVKQANFQKYPSYLIEHDGVTVGLEEGRSYSLRMLLHALLLQSGNDAANVIAENCGGSIERFMEGLNGYLKEIGVRDTQFQNPHGLHHPAQMTTALDMAKIAGHAFEYPEFVEIIRCPRFESEGKVFVTKNQLIKEGKYSYPKAIGGKIGYIEKAGHNFVAAAENGGRRLIVVLLGCARPQERFEDAMMLFDRAFREEKVIRLLFSKDHECFSLQLPKQKKRIWASLGRDVILSYYPSEESPLKSRIEWDPVKCPVSMGAPVGVLIVENERGNVLSRSPLFAVKEENISYSRLWLGLLVLPVLGFVFFQKFKKSTAKKA